MTITDKQIEAALSAYCKHTAEHGVEGSVEAMRAALEAAAAAAWEPIRASYPLVPPARPADQGDREMITDEMVKAAKDEGDKWQSGAKHDGRWSVWSVIRSDVVISTHVSVDKMFIAFAEARTRAMLDAAERAAWEPIETAPKDGTLVIVYAAPYEGLRGFITCAAYHEDAGWCVDELRHATHWRPLPTPPKGE